MGDKTFADIVGEKQALTLSSPEATLKSCRSLKHSFKVRLKTILGEDASVWNYLRHTNKLDIRPQLLSSRSLENKLALSQVSNQHPNNCLCLELQVSLWREALALAITDEGLEALRVQLSVCCTESSMRDSADTLDVVFETPGIGELLLGYTSVKVSYLPSG